MSVVHDIMDPVTSALVGRDAELEHLCSTLGISASASDQPRSAVLLAGDAGVGKTRLLTELRDRALGEGWQVLAGHCLDFADSALPYLPFSELTGRIARELPDVFDDVAERHPAVALVSSYRSDDLHRRHPLRRLVAEWARMGGVERLQLEPLAAADVRRLVLELHPDPMSEECVADIVTRAEGNAFFVEELVGATWAR